MTVRPDHLAPYGDPRRAALLAGGRPATRHEVALLAIGLPLIAYLASIWIIRPAPVAYLTPIVLALAPLAVKVPRRVVLDTLHRVKIELSLLVVIATLAVLSISNSPDPFRSFRVLYPCVLPFVLTFHLAVLASVSGSWLLAVPRLLVACGLLLSVAPLLASFAFPPLAGFLFGEYRLKGFFENSIQHAIALATLVPLLVAELVGCRRAARRLALLGVLGLVAYTLFRTGSKTAMFVSFTAGLGLFAVLKVREQSLGRSLAMALAMLAALVFLWLFGLDIATRLNPVIGSKLREIVEGGITNYQSVDSRQLLWREGLRLGGEHWLVGSGAGRKVLGISHAHNLVIDYFKGTGLFGAAAIVLLCLTILTRTAAKALSVLKRGPCARQERRVLACYVAASIYVLLNQMSDCFGPSTIGFLWAVYLCGVLSERRVARTATGGASPPAVPRR